MSTQRTAARAVAKYLPMSAQKVRLVIDAVRGMKVDDALDYLKFMPQRAAKPVRKVIKSAAANAEDALDLPPSQLTISEICAEEGPTRKWRRFGARGRFKPIKRRSSHIRVTLSPNA